MIHAGSEIFNPRTGQRMIFRRTGMETGGQLLQIECFNAPHGQQEPEHMHPFQENRFEILAGTLRFTIAGRERTAGPGDIVAIPPRTPHFFWNAGDMEAHYIQEFRPALQIAVFFETWFHLAQNGKLNAKGLPHHFQTAVLLQGFWNEMRVTQPPFVIQKLLTIVIAPLGRLLGYRDQYQVEAIQQESVRSGS
ncbi:MAG: cupin domain-containing protein [Anaerolineae bacterium]|nr:cupin domain-containing protein [Anaerolineae bacterium]